jgi:selenide,water dikinase
VEILKDLEIPSHPDLIQSFEYGADAAIFKINENTALIFSADFFTPVIDDPFVFGQISAANALSDIYVCGGKPLLALNLICFPEKGIPKEILKKILEGGLSKIKEAGALLVGGHSIDDPEPKYGLAVVGIAHPEKIISNKNAKEGDLLYLSKTIGLGILITAYKGNLLDEKSNIYKAMIKTLTELNNKIAEILLELDIKAATDITGFGLLGHALEMAIASKKDLIIYAHRVPYFKEAKDFIEMGIIPEGDYNNLNYCKKYIEIHLEVSENDLILLCDAQTSGGFLIAVPSEKQEVFEKKAIDAGLNNLALIGEVKNPEGHCPTVRVYP